MVESNGYVGIPAYVGLTEFIPQFTIVGCNAFLSSKSWPDSITNVSIKEKDIMKNIETASESKMLFYLERTGGFTGRRTTVTLNTESLPPEDASNLHQLVEDAGFFSLPEKLPEPNTGADLFNYKLTVEKFALSFSEGKKHTVEVDQLNIPESLQPLIQALEAYIIP